MNEHASRVADPAQAAELCARAEERLDAREDASAQPRADAHSLAHELQWHQIKPKIQNGQRPVTGKRIKRAPCVTDRGLVLFVEIDEPTVDGYGQIGSVTFRRPLQSCQAVTAEGDGFVYFAPAPWTQGRVLIARRPMDRSATSSVCVFDPKTVTCQVVLDDLASAALRNEPSWM